MNCSLKGEKIRCLKCLQLSKISLIFYIFYGTFFKTFYVLKFLCLITKMDRVYLLAVFFLKNLFSSLSSCQLSLIFSSRKKEFEKLKITNSTNSWISANKSNNKTFTIQVKNRNALISFCFKNLCILIGFYSFVLISYQSLYLRFYSFFLYIWTEMKFKEFEPRFKSAKIRQTPV